MVYDEIYFGGEVLHCLVEKFPTIRKAQRKFLTYNIPGRNGDIIIQQDAYQNVIVPYQISCGNDDVQTDWDDLARVLYKDGYQILSDIADPEHFRKAIFNGPVDASLYWKQIGRTTLEFNCRPERYRFDGQEVYDYEAVNDDIKKWAVSDLSNHLKNPTNWPTGTTEVYEFDLYSTWGDYFKIRNFYDALGNGRLKYVYFYSGTPATATSSIAGTTNYLYNGNLHITHINDFTLLLPVQYFDGPPQLDGTDALDTTEIYHYNSVGKVINNPYMECYPDIVLHNLGATTGEYLAAYINNYAIYITYDADSPYYFIDTETHTITKSDSLTNGRVLATNARMDAGIKLVRGENIVYTSEYYEIPSLIPNFWEL